MKQLNKERHAKADKNVVHNFLQKINVRKNRRIRKFLIIDNKFKIVLIKQ